MSLTYSTYQTSLQQFSVMNDNAGVTNLAAILPNVIDFAEQRIYRELDFLTTQTTAIGALTANSRSVSIPSTIIVLQDVNVITPVGYTADQSGASRNPLQRVTSSFLNYIWPQGTALSGSVSVPQYYTLLNATTTNPTGNTTTMLVSPSPDAAYAVEFVGTVRPTPLSATNTTTFLTTYLPDLFLTASMIYIAGYQQNFSQDGTTPGMADYWEKQYQNAKTSADVEEARKKAQSQGWTALNPAPVATPPRS